MYNIKLPMFAELKDVLKNQAEALSNYKNAVASNSQNVDFSEEYKQKQKLKIDSDYLSAKEKRYGVATELLQQQIVKFNTENIDTDFLLKCKMLGDIMPTISLKNFLDENIGSFRTAQAISEIYEGNQEKQSLINNYRLRLPRVGELPKFIDVDTYISDLGIAIDNYFTNSQTLPSTIKGYRADISYNQVINLLNAGRTSQGGEAIPFDDTGLSFKTNSEVAEPTAPSSFNFNFNK